MSGIMEAAMQSRYEAPESTLKIKLLSETATPPNRATPLAAGYDCCADLGPGEHEAAIIPPGGQAMIGLGFAMEPPAGWTGFLLPRSGLGTKKGVVLANTVGLIDEDYRQEVMACIKNNGKEHLFINHGERICQLVLLPVGTFPVGLVDELSTTERLGGFGSTGS